MTRTEYPTVISYEPHLIDFGTGHRVEFVPVLVENHNRYERVLWAWQLRGSYGDVLVSSGHDGCLHDAVQRFNAFCKRRLSEYPRDERAEFMGIDQAETAHMSIALVAATAGAAELADRLGNEPHGPYHWVQVIGTKTPIMAYSRTYSMPLEACQAAESIFRGNAAVLDLTRNVGRA